MTSNSPSPPKSAWYSFGYAVGVARSFLRKSVPAVLVGGVSKEESKFLDLKKSGVDDREPTLRDGIRLMSNGTAQEEAKIKAVAIELLHFPEGVSPTLGAGGPPPSTNSARHEDVLKDLLEVKPDERRALHPHNVSALVDGYFTLISLCLYRPDNDDSSKNLTTPYLDLSPLYGYTKEAADKIRLIDGRGTLRPDCFLEGRVQLLPPVVSALLALWNRNHNFIAHNLFIRFSANKGWKTFAAEDPDKAKQDEDIFNIVRWINCMQFRNTVAEDILKGLFGLSPFDSSLNLDVLADIPSRPKGSKMRTYKEASFLHTLNPMISERDASIVEEKMRQINDGDDIKEHSSSSFKKLYGEFLEGSNQNPTTCHYHGLQRDARTGRFKDEDLAKIFAAAREEPACAPTGRNSPSCSTIFHLQALQDERDWRTCTFNEFRKLYGLKPLPSFTAWNADPDIARAAENLYGHIDKLGLYIGLQCEAASPSGFGFGFTKTHALIVDLVTRIRSDPALEDPILLTDTNDVFFSTWIKHETAFDRSRPGNGAALPKILQRNLPQFYLYNNAYTYFLFCTPPSFDRVSIKKSGLTFDKPPDRRIHTLSDINAVQHVFKKPELYHTLYADNLSKVTNDYGYLLGFDGSLKDLHDKDRLMTMYALIPDDGSLQRYGALFGKLAALSIKKHRKPTGADNKTRIDIIGDVINEVCTRWVCETLCDYKLEDNEDDSGEKRRTEVARRRTPRSKTAKEMHKEFANLYTFIFKIFDREDGYEAERRAVKSSKYLREHIEAKIPKPEWLLSKSWGDWARQNMEYIYHGVYNLVIVYFDGIHLKAHTAQTFLERAVQASRIISIPKSDLEKRIKEKLKKRTEEKEKRTEEKLEKRIEEKLAATVPQGMKPTQEDNDEVERDIEVSRIVANILGLAAVTAVNFPQACSLVVNFYLQDKYAKEREEIVKLSKEVTNTEDERLKVNKSLAGYIHEALRLSQPLTLWRCADAEDTITTSDSQITVVQKGDVIFADFQKLHNMDQNSDKVDPNRRVESLLGLGSHKCPALTKDSTKSFIDATMPEVIKAIFGLEGLSRIANNPHSTLNSVQVHPNASRMDPRAFISQTGELAYYPQTLILEYVDSSSDNQDLKKDPKEWESGMAPNAARKVTKATEKMLAVATTFWIAYKAILALLAFWGLILLLLGYGPRLRRAVKVVQQSDVKQVYVECPEPLTIWDDWGPKIMEAGPEGKPLDIVYNSTLPIPHRLQLFDADKKDVRLALYVDDVLRGLSPDFEVDKEEDCGIEPYDCYIKKFSGADIVVPAGTHSVRVEWVGNEFIMINGTTFPDLGEDGSRRILWSRYYCGPNPFLTA